MSVLFCKVLCVQITFGSGNLKRAGVILQRGVLIMLLACFPCWSVLVNTEPLLLLVKQTPDVASKYIFFSLYKGIIWPQVITGAIGNILNAVINYVLLHILDMGVIGSAVANCITQYLLAGILCIYIIVRGLHRATWPGWSLACLQEWQPFLFLAIPSLVMTCLEFWVFELGVFLAGLISEVELGTQSVVYQLIIPLGLSAAASVRVGNALGAGNVEQAKVSATVPIISVIGGVAGGVLRGVGKQKQGAICNMLGYYVIGVPVGVSLMFAAKMGIIGKTPQFFSWRRSRQMRFNMCRLFLVCS
uniref:Solute carrier family 47 member 3 n=1 Tax=Periophthalmus magnuspinnatus TaxID=409849 RepID=A0A3B3ZFR7_9GOBI